MKFYQYINESKGGISFKEIIDNILDKCQPFLKDVVKKKKGKGIPIMYSGRKDSRDWFIKPVRKDRKPKDMPLNIHQTLDDAFNKKFGFRARSNAIFVTGSEKLTRQYGNPYIIFPVGEYKYAYNPSFKDLFINIKGHIRNHPITIHSDIDIDNWDINIDDWDYYVRDDDKKKVIGDWIAEYMNGYTNKNLHKAVNANVEIMLNCAQYIAVSIKYEPILKKYFREHGNTKISDEDFTKWYM